jgi:succinate-semialdehyde dehydrogenase/glutarate-semialdehyde dehydrogenase
MLVDPATGRTIQQVSDLNESHCLQAIKAAVSIVPILKTLTGKERGRLLRKWFNLIIQHEEDLAMIITAENGKTIAEAKGEVTYAADFVDWYASSALHVSGSVSIKLPLCDCGFSDKYSGILGFTQK